MKSLFFYICILLVLIGCKQNESTSAGHSNKTVGIKSLPISSPEEMGMNTNQLSDMTLKIEDQFYPNIHSVLIAKNGHLIFEKYFSGKDQIWGEDLGIRVHSDSALHDIRSISKSIVSACIGIAIDKGLIESENQLISDYFPDREDLKTGEKSNWTIQHFLTMTTGMVWNENVPYDDPANDEIQMSYSDDPVAYVLSKSLDTIPGTLFNYNGGATQVLAEIMEISSGMSLKDFARQYLFELLDIDRFEWIQIFDTGEYAAASGLRLTSRDLLKIGLLYRNKGRWHENQIISEHWVEKSFTPQISFPSEVADAVDEYGYQFWIWSDKFNDKNIRIVSAIGNGGQHIYWDLANDLIVVTTAGNYNHWDIENGPYDLLKDHIYPSLLN